MPEESSEYLSALKCLMKYYVAGITDQCASEQQIKLDRAQCNESLLKAFYDTRDKLPIISKDQPTNETGISDKAYFRVEIDRHQ